MLNLTSSSAIALALIVLNEVQGGPQVQKQLPLEVTDAGPNWLVKGQFYADPGLNVRFCVTHVFVAKSDAEVVGIGSDIRTKLDPENEERLRRELTEEQFNEAFGPPKTFVPGGPQLELYGLIKGGLINSRHAALEYAHTLMKSDRSAPMIPKSALTAFDQAGIWHVEAVDQNGKSIQILTFNRATGKVLTFVSR